MSKPNPLGQFGGMLLSDDWPRSRLLTALLVGVALYLALLPWTAPGARALNVAVTISVLIVLVASYDLLLGYAGMVSFAHAMFYGIGAYGVAISSHFLGPGWTSLALGVGSALMLSTVLSALLAFVSLRVRTIFFAMTTLAIASAFGALVLRWSALTGGDDGRSFSTPKLLMPGRHVLSVGEWQWQLNGRLLCYYLIVVVSAVLFLLMLRLVNSRFGRVLQAMRENEFRAEAIGYRTFFYRLAISTFAAVMATLAGVLMALWLRYVGPQNSLGFNVMLNILLMAVIGGLGTVYGAVLGVVLFVLAENYLQSLLGWLGRHMEAVPVLAQLVSAERWMLWFGVLFVLVVYFFPTGLVGTLRARAAMAATAKANRRTALASPPQ